MHKLSCFRLNVSYLKRSNSTGRVTLWFKEVLKVQSKFSVIKETEVQVNLKTFQSSKDRPISFCRMGRGQRTVVENLSTIVDDYTFRGSVLLHVVRKGVVRPFGTTQRL